MCKGSKIVALLMAVVMICCVAGCTSNNEASNEGIEIRKEAPKVADHPELNGKGGEWLEGTGGLEMPISKTLTTIKVAMSEHPSYPIKSFEKNEFLKNIARLTGIKLDIQVIPSSNYKEKLNIMLNTDDIPDVIWRTEDDALINELGTKGVFLPYNEYLDIMPNMRKLMEDYPDLENSSKAADGNMYILPFITSNTITEGIMVREDIMQKEGFTEPKTYDELYELLKAVKERYPDMIPWTIRSGGVHLYGPLAESFGTGFSGLFGHDLGTGVYLNSKTNKFTYGPLEPEFKDMVTYLAKLYAEGLIDPEYALQDTKTWEEKLSSGRTFMTVDWLTRVRWTNNLFYGNNSDMRFMGILPPVANDGDSGVVGRSYKVANEGIVISSKVKDPETVCRFLDWIYSPEGRLATSYGIEGVTYLRNDDGTISWHSDLKDSKNPDYTKELNPDFGGQMSGFCHYEINSTEHLVSNYPSAFDDRQTATNLLYTSNNAVLAPPPTFVFSKERQDVRNDKETNLRDYVTAEIDKFIMGLRSLDEWDQFTEEIRKRDVDEILKAYNDAYADYLK